MTEVKFFIELASAVCKNDVQARLNQALESYQRWRTTSSNPRSGQSSANCTQKRQCSTSVLSSMSTSPGERSRRQIFRAPRQHIRGKTSIASMSKAVKLQQAVAVLKAHESIVQHDPIAELEISCKTGMIHEHTNANSSFDEVLDAASRMKCKESAALTERTRMRGGYMLTPSRHLSGESEHETNHCQNHGISSRDGIKSKDSDFKELALTSPLENISSENARRYSIQDHKPILTRPAARVKHGSCDTYGFKPDGSNDEKEDDDEYENSNNIEVSPTLRTSQTNEPAVSKQIVTSTKSNGADEFEFDNAVSGNNSKTVSLVNYSLHRKRRYDDCRYACPNRGVVLNHNETFFCDDDSAKHVIEGEENDHHHSTHVCESGLCVVGGHAPGFVDLKGNAVPLLKLSKVRIC